MTEKKGQLVHSAMELIRLGKKLEEAKRSLKKLVDRGIPYESPEMIAAYEKCQQHKAQWQELERQHLSLRDNL